MSLRTILVLLISACSVQAIAQDSTVAKKPEAGKMKSYGEVISAKAVSKTGLFAVHKVDEKYYFEIPDSLFNRELLFTTRLVKVPTGSPMFGGEVVNNIIVSFEKATEEKLYMRVVTNVAVANPTDAIAKAVRNSTIDPIVMVVDVKAKGKANSSYVVDVTDFFLKDNNITGFDAISKKNMAVGGAAADRSFILSMDAYQQNIEVKSVKTFTLGAAPKPGGDAPGEAAGPSANNGAMLTMELSNSIMLLPKQKMASRYSDPRVGYYTESVNLFSDKQQKVEVQKFIVRQRLEPKDIERYRKGELVEPKEQIVYYIDPATPKQWRPYIIEGVNAWNKAFEAAGFKNAIVGKEWPENDSTMSLEDSRCKVIRYFPSNIGFSSSERIYDPRSGEILQTYIGWSHSKLQALHDWYFTQAAAVDPRARSAKFSNELMGELIKADITKQVGHTLGLRVNPIGSNAYPVEKLRDKKWVEANGFSSSIMDYVHYNYVAQPEDGISSKGLIPQIGEYDVWAIKYGYTYTGCTDYEKEREEVLSWINKEQLQKTSLRFRPEVDILPNAPTDPRSQSEDLSNNAIKASEYGLKNLKIVTTNLLKWSREDLDMYDNTARAYDNILDWWGMLTRHVYSQIGGTHENLKTSDQAGNVYEPVSRETQKQAVAFLNKEVFQQPTWLADPAVLNKFHKPIRRDKFLKLQENALYYAMTSEKLYRLSIQAMRYDKSKIYTADELLTDISNGLWKELSSSQPLINTNRRALQKAWVENMKNVMKEASNPPAAGSASPDLTYTDVPVLLRAHMDKVMKQCKTAIPLCKDQMTLAHLKYVQGKLESILEDKAASKK